MTIMPAEIEDWRSKASQARLLAGALRIGSRSREDTMPIIELRLDATYEFPDGREAVPYREFSKEYDGGTWVRVVIHWAGNVTYEDYPKVKFMQTAIRKLKDPPSNFTE
jgi:hypothetical protein